MLSALCGQSTTSDPKRRKLALISSEGSWRWWRRRQRRAKRNITMRDRSQIQNTGFSYLRRCRAASRRRTLCASSARRTRIRTSRRGFAARSSMATANSATASGSTARACNCRCRSCRNNLLKKRTVESRNVSHRQSFPRRRRNNENGKSRFHHPITAVYLRDGLRAIKRDARLFNR